MYLVVVLLAACSTTQQITEKTVTGENYLAMGQYEEALNYFENNIRETELKEKAVSGDIYRKAGIAAYKLDNKSKAQTYFERAANLNSTSGEMLLMQADCYRNIDNLSKEIITLERFLELYSSNKDVDKVKLRLFETCLESENWDQAEILWSSFGANAKTNKKLMDVYLKVNIALKNDEKANLLAAELLKLDANNVTALERIAENYFWKAENRYQVETKAYDKKKTRSQYAKLLKALDVVTLDFKKSLTYYKKLYTINADKKYARFLGNIYARLDDKEKSTYYKNRAR